MAIHHANAERVREHIHFREPFEVASMRGVGRDGDPMSYISLGQLDSEHWDSVRRATYVVYSYQTPIAWFADGVWTVPDRYYSNTTSGHQGLARVGISHGRLS